MRIGIDLTPPGTANTFANVRVQIPDESTLCTLKIDFTVLRSLTVIPPDIVLDLLLLAQAVYALDRRVLREDAPDRWTRRFSLTLPVSDPSVWSATKTAVNSSLSFLTGDLWNIDYEARDTDLVSFPDNTPQDALEADAVSLFSGGLDSLIGVIDYLEINHTNSLILVGHHDPRIAGPRSDQIAVLEHLKQHYSDRIHPLLIAAGPDCGNDTTLRSRSFLFIALGVYAASTLSDNATLLVPENGNIALNAPLTPSRTGSCSTRTVHPYFLVKIKEILAALGIDVLIANPLETKTKGECLAECLNRDALMAALPATTSCAKRGHTNTWLRRSAKQCGRCMPCIYRRAALNKIDADHEIYGRDVCTSEVDVNSTNEYADDFRAFLSFLHSNPPRDDIATLLFSNGKLEISKLDSYADVVARAMKEVRDLLRDKATDEVKHQTGIDT